MRILATILNSKLNIAKNPGKLFGFNNHCYFYNPCEYKYGFLKYGFLKFVQKYFYKNSLPWRKWISRYLPTGTILAS